MIAPQMMPKKLPEHWLNCEVNLSFGSPIMDPRSGAVKWNAFAATIVTDFEDCVELQTAEGLRLFPKALIVYLTKAATVGVYKPGEVGAAAKILTVSR